MSLSRISIFTTAALALSLSAANAASGEPVLVIDSTLGPVLASARSGFSLYTFRKDTKGVSNCLGDCIRAQPPFLASPEARPIDQFDIVRRQDGGLQWALDGRPLYFSARDRVSGDALGHGFRDVWDVVKVTGPAAQTAVAPLNRATAPVEKVVAAPARVDPAYAAPVYAPTTTYDTTHAAPAYGAATSYGTTYAAPAYGTTYAAPAHGTTYAAPAHGTTYAAPAHGTTYAAPAHGTTYAAPAHGTTTTDTYSAPAYGTTATYGTGYSAPAYAPAPAPAYDTYTAPSGSGY